MKKHILLVRGARKTPYDTFSRQIKERLAAAADSHDLSGLKVTLTERPPPLLTPIPFLRRRLACVSLWTSLPTPPLPASTPPLASTPPPVQRLMEALGTGVDSLHLYKVDESVPVAYDFHPDPGEKTPGVGLLTLMNRNPNMGVARFRHEWFGKHTPMTLKIHPVWQYVRNVVTEPHSPAAPPYEGIVEEHFREPRDLLNTVRFFGGPTQFFFNMIRVGLHIRTFLDLSRIETYFVHEYTFKTPF